MVPSDHISLCLVTFGLKVCHNAAARKLGTGSNCSNMFLFNFLFLFPFLLCFIDFTSFIHSQSLSFPSSLCPVLPSVSLLQKTPSSPVSCYAAGFYLDKAVMFWRKDGDEIHDGVEKGDILPNDDGTFQIIVDLNVSSVKPEDWWRYECVFQFLSGENIIVTKLKEIMIRTNWRENILRTGRGE